MINTRPNAKFVAKAPSKIVSMVTFENRVIVACESGVFWIKRTNAKNPKYRLIPIKSDHT